MDVLFVIALVAMLILVGYAKVQQGVVRTTGPDFFVDDEDNL